MQAEPKILDCADFNRGYWTEEENRKYRIFLEFHYDKFRTRRLKRAEKLFFEMSLYINSRQSHQCRSHHQKMEKKFADVDAIISFLRQQEALAELDCSKKDS
jgi:hypothetical protein